MRRMQLLLATDGVLLMWREKSFYITMRTTLEINQVIKSQGGSKLKNTSRHKALIY